MNTDNVIPFHRRLPEPGDVMNPNGDLWLKGKQAIRYGEVSLSLRQARAAELHGWNVVADTEIDGRVIVRREFPVPRI